MIIIFKTKLTKLKIAKISVPMRGLTQQHGFNMMIGFVTLLCHKKLSDFKIDNFQVVKRKNTRMFPISVFTNQRYSKNTCEKLLGICFIFWMVFTPKSRALLVFNWKVGTVRFVDSKIFFGFRLLGDKKFICSFLCHWTLKIDFLLKDLMLLTHRYFLRFIVSI